MKKFISGVLKVGAGYVATFAAGPALLGGSGALFAISGFTLDGFAGYLTATAMGIGTIMTFAILIALPQLHESIESLQREIS